MFIYESSTGKMYYRNTDAKKLIDKFVAQGYSGAGTSKNNPDAQDIHDVGPIPVGWWTISGPPIETTEHGPYVLHLFPDSYAKTFGRTGFLIHGDSKRFPGMASKGCIILPLTARQYIWQSNDTKLLVIKEFTEEQKNGDKV